MTIASSTTSKKSPMRSNASLRTNPTQRGCQRKMMESSMLMVVSLIFLLSLTNCNGFQPPCSIGPRLSVHPLRITMNRLSNNPSASSSPSPSSRSSSNDFSYIRTSTQRRFSTSLRSATISFSKKPWKRWRNNRSKSTSTSTNDSITTSSKSRVHENNWTSQNLAIAMPALMGLLADPVLSLVDTGFVGRIGPMDLAALGVCTSIFHMAFTVFRASTVATTSLVASAKSQADKRQITKISLQLAGVLGTCVFLGLQFGGPALLATMGVDKASPIYKPACSYLFSRCWAAPAVVGIVVAEGAFRGNDDSTTPLIASGFAALLNLILDPILMFPLGMGMAGAAMATAVSQLGAGAIYGWRLMKRQLLPQPNDAMSVNTKKVIKSILGANLAMLAKQGSLLVFYTMATALATRMGPPHVATHQVALSLFWLVTYWLDSGSISSQVLMGKNLSEPSKARSLTKYMLKYALIQGLAFSALVGGIGGFVPGAFTQDANIQSLLLQCLPHLAFQQTLVSLTLILEGLAIGGNQFRFMAAGTAVSTAIGVWQLLRADSVVGIWATAVSTFFGCRLVNGILGVARVHWRLQKRESQSIHEATTALNAVTNTTTTALPTTSIS